MAGSPPQVFQKFDITPHSGTSSPMHGNQTAMIVPREVFATFDKIINPELVFLNKMTRLLFKAELVPTDVIDPNSPVTGHKLIGIGRPIDPENLYEDRGQLVDWDGYNVIVGNYMLLASEVISTSDFDVSEINLIDMCIDGIWAIIVQIVANWEDWHWKDPYEIETLGLEMWFNLYGLTRRSINGKGLEFITDLVKHLVPHPNAQEEKPNALRFWPTNTKSE